MGTTTSRSKQHIKTMLLKEDTNETNKPWRSSVTSAQAPPCPSAPGCTEAEVLDLAASLGPSDSFSDKSSQKHEALDTVNDMTGLTLRQCRAVQECWRDFTIGSVNRLGVQFLVRFFLAFPDYRNFYGALRSDSDVHNKGVNRRELRMLQDSNELRELAMAYMDTLTAIFTQLHDQKAVTTVLENLTDRHLPRGVFSLHFQDMMATLLKFIEEKTGRGRMDTVTRDSWTTALRTVITIIDQRCLLLQHKIYTRA